MNKYNFRNKNRGKVLSVRNVSRRATIKYKLLLGWMQIILGNNRSEVVDTELGFILTREKFHEGLKREDYRRR